MDKRDLKVAYLYRAERDLICKVLCQFVEIQRMLALLEEPGTSEWDERMDNVSMAEEIIFQLIRED